MTVPGDKHDFRVTTLSAEDVEMLFGQQQHLSLEGVTALSVEAAAALRTHHAIHLPERFKNDPSVKEAP